MELTQNPMSNSSNKSNSTIKDGEILAPIRFIRFTDLEFADKEKQNKRNSFPRNPNDSDLCTPINKIETDKCLLIFLSHCWLRGYPLAPGYDKQPHPDNASHQKFQLMIAALKSLIYSQTNGITEENVYVWIDFSSMNQDEDAAGELKQLKKIVQVCDLMLTPLVDDEHEKWKLQQSDKRLLNDYKAAAWCGNKHSYLNRSWCRVEMLYAANVPILSKGKIKLFKNALSHAACQGRRPHFLYGSKELYENRQPLCLPPLKYSYLDDYNPIDGELSYEEDRYKIKSLVSELQPYINDNKLVVGYTGPRNLVGKPHGIGKEVFSSGAVYEGSYIRGLKDGLGKYSFETGETFEGHYEKGFKNGKGIYKYSSGSTCDGEWINDMIHGVAVITDQYGNIFKSKWENGNRLSEYIGERNELGERHGQGVEYYSDDGSTYDGSWKNNKKDGKGKVIYRDGLVFEGNFTSGVRSGDGTLVWPSGSKFTGTFVDDKGSGILKEIGRHEYRGDVNLLGQRHGQGAQVFREGEKKRREMKGRWECDVLKEVLCLQIFTSVEDQGYLFEGQIKHNLNSLSKPLIGSGYGKVTYPNGVVYSGYFDDLGIDSYDGQLYCCKEALYRFTGCPSFCCHKLQDCTCPSTEHKNFCFHPGDHLSLSDYKECFYTCFCLPVSQLVLFPLACLPPVARILYVLNEGRYTTRYADEGQSGEFFDFDNNCRCFFYNTLCRPNSELVYRHKFCLLYNPNFCSHLFGPCSRLLGIKKPSYYNFCKYFTMYSSCTVSLCCTPLMCYYLLGESDDNEITTDLYDTDTICIDWKWAQRCIIRCEHSRTISTLSYLPCICPFMTACASAAALVDSIKISFMLLTCNSSKLKLFNANLREESDYGRRKYFADCFCYQYTSFVLSFFDFHKIWDPLGYSEFWGSSPGLGFPGAMFPNM